MSVLDKTMSCMCMHCHLYPWGGFLSSQPILMTAESWELSSLMGVDSLPVCGKQKLPFRLLRSPSCQWDGPWLHRNKKTITVHTHTWNKYEECLPFQMIYKVYKSKITFKLKSDLSFKWHSFIIKAKNSYRILIEDALLLKSSFVHKVM